MSAPLRAKKKNNTIVYLLLGLLALSLTGFGVRSVGSGGRQAVATVGDQKVTVDQYARALTTQLRAVSQQIGTNLTLEQARAFGLDRQVLQEVLVTAALDGEAARLGLSVGDVHVRNTLLKTEAFQDLTGKFDQTAYTFALEQNNLKPAQYDEIIRSDATRRLLQTAVAAGIKTGKSYSLAMLDYIAEERSFHWALMGDEFLSAPVRSPSEAEIKAEYQANPAAYTSPEIRKITYVHLSPEMLDKTIGIEESSIRALYDSEAAKYNQPERRIVDRLAFGSSEAAAKALADIKAGTYDFDALVKGRNLTDDDIDMGEVSAADLAPAAAKAVFAQPETGLVGPVESSLGPALFRVNAILQAHSTPYDEVRDELRTSLVADRARRQVEDLMIPIEDKLAAGATLEDLAAETEMQLGHIDYFNGDEEGLAAYDEFRQAAEAAKSGDFPELLTLEDGGIFALRLDAVVPPTLKPLDQVRDQVAKDWTRAETRRQVLALAATFKTRIQAGESFADLGLAAKSEQNIKRDHFIEGAPKSMVDSVFQMDQGQITTVSDADQVVLVALDGITPFDPQKPDNAALIKQIEDQYSQQLGAEVFQSFATAIEDKAGISINQNLIAAIQAQIP